MSVCRHPCTIYFLLQTRTIHQKDWPVERKVTPPKNCCTYIPVKSHPSGEFRNNVCAFKSSPRSPAVMIVDEKMCPIDSVTDHAVIKPRIDFPHAVTSRDYSEEEILLHRPTENIKNRVQYLLHFINSWLWQLWIPVHVRTCCWKGFDHRGGRKKKSVSVWRKVCSGSCLDVSTTGRLEKSSVIRLSNKSLSFFFWCIFLFPCTHHGGWLIWRFLIFWTEAPAMFNSHLREASSLGHSAVIPDVSDTEYWAN